MKPEKINLAALSTVAGAWQTIYPAYCREFLWECATFGEFRNLVSERFFLDGSQWNYIRAMWDKFHPNYSG